MEFKILDGRGSFYQWDLHQKLQVEDPAVETVHFPTEEETALVCPVYEKDGKRLVDVPNCVLQISGILRIFAIRRNRTLYVRNFRVNPREKPDDYIYTETEVWTAEKAVETALQEAKDNGDFKGDKGDKGDAVTIASGVENGVLVVKTVTVTEEGKHNLLSMDKED